MVHSTDDARTDHHGTSIHGVAERHIVSFHATGQNGQATHRHGNAQGEQDVKRPGQFPRSLVVRKVQHDQRVFDEALDAGDGPTRDTPREPLHDRVVRNIDAVPEQAHPEQKTGKIGP